MRATLEFLKTREVTAYLVGGWLRDALLGRESGDVDLLVQGDAHALARTLADSLEGAYVPLHDAPDIARVVVGAEGGESWTLDLSSLEVPLAEDLARRDFTMNALALPLERLEGGWSKQDVIDPLGGLGALQEGLVRVVSDRVFREDPVRLLRAIRLAAQLGFRIEPATLELMEQDAPLLEGTAGERVRDEFLKTLAVQGATLHLRLMDQVGLLCRVLPELEAGKGVEQPREHHYWDVFYHNVETPGMVERLLDREGAAGDDALSLTPWDPALDGHFTAEVCDGFSHGVFLKLAGLLHDVGKPAAKSVEPSGRIRFLEHNQMGAPMAGAALRRLRVGGRGVRLVEAMVRHHLRPGQLSQAGELPTRRAVYRYYRDLAEAALDTLYLNLADYLAARGPDLEMEDWRSRCQAIAMVLEAPEETAARLPLRLLEGHDLMETFHLQPGPLIGRVLEVVREAQAVGEVTTREEALALARGGRWMKW